MREVGSGQSNSLMVFVLWIPWFAGRTHMTQHHVLRFRFNTAKVTVQEQQEKDVWVNAQEIWHRFQVFLRRELHGHNFLCSCERSRHVQDVCLARETHEYYSPEFFQEVGHTDTFLPSGQPGNWNSEPRRDTKAYIINFDDYFKIANILVHPDPLPLTSLISDNFSGVQFSVWPGVIAVVQAFPQD